LITWLVVFVLLWVVGTVFAIYYYVDGNKAREELEALTKQYADILPRGQLNSDEVNTLKNKRTADTTGRLNPSMPVFEVLNTERTDLATVIGRGDVPDQALSSANAALDKAAAQAKAAGVNTRPPNLIAAVDTLTSTLVARQNDVTKLNEQLEQANKEVAAATEKMQSQQAAFTKAMEDLRGETKTASASLDTDRQAKDEQIKKLTDQFAADQKAMQDQLAQQQQTVADLNKEIERDKRLITDLQLKLGVKRSNTADSVVRQADGQIIRSTGGGSVYINLGSGDQISPGLTFEVYDRSEGVPTLGENGSEDATLPKGKGSIEVVRVGAGSSECRVINTQPGQVIREGDVIANLVYDKNTKYNFFVYGDFDLDQNDVATPQDAEVVKRLVTQWGGKNIDKVNADTDFVVLGKEPTVLVPSKEEANDPIIQAKAQASQAAFDAYEEVKKQALDYHIPILNQNRFLYYVGYFEQAQR
jgi:hypothetical protein